MDGMFTGGDNPEGLLSVMGFGIDCKSTLGKGYGGKMNESSTAGRRLWHENQRGEPLKAETND